MSNNPSLGLGRESDDYRYRDNIQTPPESNKHIRLICRPKNTARKKLRLTANSTSPTDDKRNQASPSFFDLSTKLGEGGNGIVYSSDLNGTKVAKNAMNQTKIFHQPTSERLLLIIHCLQKEHKPTNILYNWSLPSHLGKCKTTPYQHLQLNKHLFHWIP